MITRRNFFRWLAGLPLLSSFPFTVTRVCAQPALPPQGRPKVSIGDVFAGEVLHYEIAFWLFKKVALAKLSFHHGDRKGRYVATLEGETLGILGFLARYRVDSYRSVMEEIHEGGRLRSLSFEEYVKVGSKVRENIHTFDHQRRKWTHRTIRSSGATSTVEKDIPDGASYDDFLTVAYNFRYGVYGAVERGKNYSLPTFPRKDVTSYEVKVASKVREERRRKSEDPREGSEYRIDLALDPEVINSKEGVIEGWLAKELYPVEGTIKDVILFGDVHGSLTKREKPTDGTGGPS
jgi:hypothetical protein